jgi:hypothetical protein
MLEKLREVLHIFNVECATDNDVIELAERIADSIPTAFKSDYPADKYYNASAFLDGLVKSSTESQDV